MKTLIERLQDPELYVDAVDEAAARIAELERLLRRVEWMGTGYNSCPICKGSRYEGHYDGCQLAAALGAK